GGRGGGAARGGGGRGGGAARSVNWCADGTSVRPRAPVVGRPMRPFRRHYGVSPTRRYQALQQAATESRTRPLPSGVPGYRNWNALRGSDQGRATAGNAESYRPPRLQSALQNCRVRGRMRAKTLGCVASFTIAVAIAGSAAASEYSVSIAGMSVTMWTGDLQSPIARPVIIFSHGLRGCATQSRFLMEAFEKAGYLVFAPNHRDASCGQRR